MSLSKQSCLAGCFWMVLMGILSVFLIYEFGTRPRATHIDNVPIEAWLSKALTLEGADQKKAVTQTADLMLASLGPGIMNCGFGILGPGAVAKNNQMREDAKSILLHFGRIEALFHKALCSDQIETRRATIQAIPIFFVWANDAEQKSMCKLLVAACKDRDVELASEARQSLMELLSLNPHHATVAKIEGISGVVDAALEDGLSVPDKLVDALRE